MGRIFTFGCSFTDYQWPTWADIILYDNEGFNMGVSGSGNVSMFYRIMEADRKYRFTNEDQIIVMFTTPIRWDLITGTPPIFLGYGQVTSVDKIAKYENELFSIEGLCFQSFYSILAIKNYLESKNVKYLFGGILNIFEDLDNYFKLIEINEELKKLISHVKTEVKFELPSMYDFLIREGYIKNRSWGITKKWDGYNDYHPRPHQYYDFVVKEIQPKISFDLKISTDKINQIEQEIDSNNNMIDYMDFFSKNYQYILNKKMGPEIFYKIN